MTSLCGVWWCSNTIFMANTLPKSKRSSSWMIPFVSKEEVLCVRVHSHGITRNKYYGVITKRMNFNCPVAETRKPRSSSIERNYNNLKLNAIAYTFSKIDSNLNFNNSFGDRELLASVSLVFPQRRTRKLKEYNTFSAVEDSFLLQWHSGAQKHVGRAKERDQIDNEEGLFWKAMSKQSIKAWLASLSFDSSRAPTEWSAIFAFGVCVA